MNKNSKVLTAVVYDKWLHTLGGGEVVACSVAKILRDEGYDVLFISGKEVSKETILNKLKIDLKKIEFKQVWNDETAIKKLVEGKDIFVNVSFMDYTIGFAKKNIYYVNFPTKLYNTLRGMIVNRFLLPFASKFIKPVEALSHIEAPVVIQGCPAYVLGKFNRYALTNLNPGKQQEVVFRVFFENFYKSLLESINISIDNGKIENQKAEVNHKTNTIKFVIKFIPDSETAYLDLNIDRVDESQKMEDGKIYIFYPKMYLSKMQNFFFQDFFQRISVRLRAGVFINIGKRLSTYQKVITYSEFAWKWIRKYWNIEAAIVAPPVDMLYKKYNVDKYKKNNWICSVGRFFTLGHGKKQEIMIQAFKKLYDQGDKSWELHLVGGLGDEPSSIDFFKYLKDQSEGYPIFFHINVSGKEVEEVYLKSKIYWHATGFGEDSHDQPIRFEHFGISPIEAISAKCIPILFKGGGLPEIINKTNLDLKRNLFSSIDELVRNTLFYQNKGDKDQDWKFIFSKLEEHYTYQAFKDNFLKLVNKL